MTERAERDPLAGKLPVTLVTGYLGSGKTTLIGRLLRHPGMDRSAVIVNEFGEVGIDHELVQEASGATALLANGCLCCAVMTDLQRTLRELFARRRAGEIMDFERVFVEASGIADPVPVLHTLRTDGLLGAHYRLDAVVALVDAVNGMGNLEREFEALRQVAVADRIVITKPDLAAPGAVEALEQRVGSINPYAPRKRALNGALEPEFLRDVGPSSVRAAAGLERWLGVESGEDRYLGERARRTRHDAAAFSLFFERPFALDAFTSALQTLIALRGADLLRVKGLVNIAGERGPLLVQGAQHLFHPPVTLDAWPSEDRRSRLVFIARNLEREAVEKVFAAIAGIAPAAR